MNPFRVILFALSLSLSGMTAGAQQSEANRPRGPEIVNLTLHGQAATRPALQFKLLPDVTDQRPGNGAGLYLAAARVGPDPKAADELSGHLGDRFRDLPMDQLAVSFGVSRANIEAIVYRRSWQHLAHEGAEAGALVTSAP